MRGMRRQIRRVAGSWLVLQLLVTVWVPVALYASTHHEESAAEECTCEHPTGGVCPMHRHSTGTPSPTAGCSLRSALDPLEALVSAIIGPSGVLPSFVTTIGSPEIHLRPLQTAGTPLDRLVPPDSPPPRL
jgi:hypothetical protein